MSYIARPTNESAAVLAVVAALVSGCGKGEAPPANKVSDKPKVQLVQPDKRTITRTVDQPSFVEAFEQTAMYAKLPAFVEKWNVDIGDRLKKDDVLATLFIPELVQEHEQKKAGVLQDQALVDQSLKLVEVADGNLKATVAQVAEAKANVGKFEALVLRWQSEVKRQTSLAAEKVIDQQVLDESTRQLQASTASRDAANAAVLTATANRVAAQAALDKAKVDISVAKARLKVSEADERRLAALVGYTKLTAPYPGIVIARNANTGDFVLPATGDPSAAPRSADQSAARATPVYTVARIDVMRIYVDVPEADGNYIVSQVDRKNGDKRPVTKARVRVPALADAEFPAEVTRTSLALNAKSRTLRAEIDLPNADAKLRPQMYAYGMVLIERPNVRALPESAVVELGNQMCCWLYVDGKAVKTPVQTAVSDGTWIEVTRKLVRKGPKDPGTWEEFTGGEQVITGDLAQMADGMEVTVVTGDKSE